MERIENFQNHIKIFLNKNKKHVSIFSKVGVLMFFALWFSGLTRTATDIIFIILVMTTIAVLLFVIHPSKFQV